MRSIVDLAALLLIVAGALGIARGLYLYLRTRRSTSRKVKEFDTCYPTCPMPPPRRSETVPSCSSVSNEPPIEEFSTDYLKADCRTPEEEMPATLCNDECEITNVLEMTLGVRPPRVHVKYGTDASQMNAVKLGAAAPGEVTPGQDFTARFVAYRDGFESVVSDILSKCSPQSRQALGVYECCWQKGVEISVRCHGKQVEVDSPVEIFTWNGDYHILTFDVTSLNVSHVTGTALKFDVSIAGITIAKLRLDLTITANPDKNRNAETQGAPIRTAFASYAHEDAGRVLDRVAEIMRNGVDVFLDATSLRAGDEWQKKLEEQIRLRDVFVLFWSTNASRSDWVKWELRTALAHKSLGEIEPHPLEPPNVVAPPEELKSLHFGDPTMLVRRAIENSHHSS